MTRYKLRQRLFSIGEDYDIEDADGHTLFHVDGKLFRIRATFVIEDRQGQEVATIKQKLLALRKTMTIERGGVASATLRKVSVEPQRQHRCSEESADRKDDVAGHLLGLSGWPQ